MEEAKIRNLYNLDKTIARELLDNINYPWEALKDIKEFIIKKGATLSLEEYDHPADDVWISKDAKIFPSAYIGGPCIIGKNTEVRHCAFIRGSAIIGENCVVGNSTELKNVILFDNAKVPHYNYVGDSILGYKSHMGAGSITSNVKSDQKLVTIKSSDEMIETGLKKVGAFLGDNVEIGCNSVLCPGTVVGMESIVYPLSRVRGVISQKSIYKDKNDIVERKMEE